MTEIATISDFVTQASAAQIQAQQFITQDFDDQASLLKGWNQHYVQMSSGAFNGAISELLFDDIHLFKESTSQALFQRGQLPEDVIAIGVPLHVQGHGLFCGTLIHSEKMPVFSGRDGFEFYSPLGMTMGGITLHRDALLASLPADQYTQVLSGMTSAHLKHVGRQQILAAQHCLQTAFTLSKTSPALFESTNFRADLRNHILQTAADILLGDQNQAHQDMTPSKRWKIVMQARDYIRDQNDAFMNVEALCVQLNISRRTLQYCFQEMLGISPVEFMRNQRLNGVRQLLKESKTVTEAATALGFWHFGHFSHEYKKLFGELPSDTLRRTH